MVMKKILINIFLAVVIISMALISCSSSSSPTNTLKIGLVFSFRDDVGLDGIRGIELVAAEDNKNGGIEVGGKKYKVELVKYDNSNAQSTEVSAINKLIFEDKVKFIATQGLFQGAWLPTTEKNKVIILSMDPLASVDLSPNTHYSFNPTFMGPEVPAKIGWFCNTYRNKANNTVAAYVDNQFGHMVAMLSESQFKTFGITPKVIFFPANQVDLSAVATKILSMNPGVVMGMSGSSTTDGLFFSSVHQAGYKGQFFSPTNNPIETWLQVASPEVLEGLITGMDYTESEPALNKAGQQFKELWIAKYGKWNNPRILGVSTYYCLKAALAKAGSLDTDKVSEAIASGLEFPSPTGDGKMISRPDVGNNRTVDSITDFYMKQIRKGKSEVLVKITMEKALSLMRQAFPPLPAGAKLLGPPPNGAPPRAPTR
jgi:branched-chain amino acid transport system substrate-binding protein